MSGFVNRIRLLLFYLLLVQTGFSQVPQGIPYQAIARNGQGQPLAILPVKVRFSVLDSTASGPVVYSETHTPSTSAQGLFSVHVGMGNPSQGTFSGINWGVNAKFLKVELDTTASGNNYVDLGTQQMMSVPYALIAGSTMINKINSPNFNYRQYLPPFNHSANFTTSTFQYPLLCPQGLEGIYIDGILVGQGGPTGGTSVVFSVKDSLGNNVEFDYYYYLNGQIKEIGNSTSFNIYFGDYMAGPNAVQVTANVKVLLNLKYVLGAGNLILQQSIIGNTIYSGASLSIKGYY